MLKYLRGILMDIEKRTRWNLSLPGEYELMRSLSFLEGYEKELIKKKFLETNWNIGTPRVIHLLTQAKITNITEYLQEIEDPEKIQSILNELLEVQFELIAELVATSTSNQKIENHLRICLEKFVKDAIETPEVFSENFLLKIGDHLTDIQMQRFSEQILELILNYKEGYQQICDAISSQNKWNQQFLEPRFNMIRESIKVVCKFERSVLVKLMEEAGKSNFEGWFYYLQILRILIENPSQESVDYLKEILKDLFQNFLRSSNELKFFQLLITVRQLSYFGQSHFGDLFYKTWYKKTIAEMMYSKLKKDDFIRVLETLTNLVIYEKDPEILKIHINTGINAPSLCSSYVVDFKQYSKSRLAILESSFKERDAVDLTESERIVKNTETIILED